MMKNIVAYIVVAIVVSMAFTRCSKSSNTLPADIMTAKAGNHAFSVTQITATDTNGKLTITGVDAANNRTITLVVDKFTAQAGTVYLAANSVEGIYDSSLTSAEYGSWGNITFTSVSPQLVGAFNFYCTDNTSITNGTFVVTSPF